MAMEVKEILTDDKHRDIIVYWSCLSGDFIFEVKSPLTNALPGIVNKELWKLRPAERRCRAMSGWKSGMCSFARRDLSTRIPVTS